MKDIILKSNKNNLKARLWTFPNTRKAIIIAHSFRNTMDEPACFEAAETFAKNGYTVLSFNFLGHGNSDGELKDVSFNSLSENISSAIRYLKKSDIQHIGVYSISIGTIATVLSKEQPDAQVFVSATPLGDPRSLLKRYSEYIDEEKLRQDGYCEVISGSGRGKFGMGAEWIREMRDSEFNIEKIYKKNNIRTLIIQGTNDSIERIEKVRMFVESTESEYLEIRGADHNFTDKKYRNILIEKSLSWFNKNLAA